MERARRVLPFAFPPGVGVLMGVVALWAGQPPRRAVVLGVLGCVAAALWEIAGQLMATRQPGQPAVFRFKSVWSVLTFWGLMILVFLLIFQMQGVLK